MNEWIKTFDDVEVTRGSNWTSSIGIKRVKEEMNHFLGKLLLPEPLCIFAVHNGQGLRIIQNGNKIGIFGPPLEIYHRLWVSRNYKNWLGFSKLPYKYISTRISTCKPKRIRLRKVVELVIGAPTCNRFASSFFSLLSFSFVLLLLSSLLPRLYFSLLFPPSSRFSPCARWKKTKTIWLSRQLRSENQKFEQVEGTRGLLPPRGNGSHKQQSYSIPNQVPLLSTEWTRR